MEAAPPVFTYLFVKLEITYFQKTIDLLKKITSLIIKSYKALIEKFSWKNEKNKKSIIKLLDTLKVNKTKKN